MGDAQQGQPSNRTTETEDVRWSPNTRERRFRRTTSRLYLTAWWTAVVVLVSDRIVRGGLPLEVTSVWQVLVLLLGVTFAVQAHWYLRENSPEALEKARLDSVLCAVEWDTLRRHSLDPAKEITYFRRTPEINREIAEAKARAVVHAGLGRRHTDQPPTSNMT